MIAWWHFPRYWSFVRGIHRSPMNSPHKGHWRGALMFSLISVWIYGWVKQSWGWWFETPLRSLWRHCNEVGRFLDGTLTPLVSNWLYSSINIISLPVAFVIICHSWWIIMSVIYLIMDPVYIISRVMMSFVTNNKHARHQCAFFPTLRQYFDSLVQDCSNPITSALGLLLDFL